jgi:hypothetical protein
MSKPARIVLVEDHPYAAAVLSRHWTAPNA